MTSRLNTNTEEIFREMSVNIFESLELNVGSPPAPSPL